MSFYSWFLNKKSISKAINPNLCSQMLVRDKPQYNMTHLMPNSKLHHCHSYNGKCLFCSCEIKSSWTFEFSAPKFTSLEQKSTLCYLDVTENRISDIRCAESRVCHWETMLIRQQLFITVVWIPTVVLKHLAGQKCQIVLNKLKQTPTSSKI